MKRYNGGFRWHDLLPLRDRIDDQTRMVDADYLLVFGAEPHGTPPESCETGYTDFSQQRCWVNAEFCVGRPRDQFVVTVFLAAHERAHARWTEFVAADLNLRDGEGAEVLHPRTKEPFTDRVLHTIWNVLEDERIERLLEQEFSMLNGYLQTASALIHKQMPLLEITGAPSEVIGWLLTRQRSARGGLSLPCPLNPEQVQLLAQCEPLIQEAYHCASARRVVELAREIQKILELDYDSTMAAIRSMLSAQMGVRGAGDSAEEQAPDMEPEDPEIGGSGKGTHSDVLQAASDVLAGAGYSPGEWGRHDLVPGPYEALLRSVQPWVGEVAPLFQTPPTKRVDTLDISGGRLSMRAARRSPATPFRVPGEMARRGSVELVLVLDESGSMTGSKEHEAKRAALLCLEGLAGHKVRVALAPSGTIVVQPGRGDMNRAFLAGYTSNQGTEFGRVYDEETRRLRESSATSRWCILVADGESGDYDGQKCREVVLAGRRQGVRMLGIGIQLGPGGDAFYRGVFDSAYIPITRLEELAPRMRGILRRVARASRLGPSRSV